MSRERKASGKPLQLEYNSSFGFSFKQIIKMIPERQDGTSTGPNKQTPLPFAQKQAETLPYKGILLLSVSFPSQEENLTCTICPSQHFSADKTLVSERCCGRDMGSKMLAFSAQPIQSCSDLHGLSGQSARLCGNTMRVKHFLGST